jgi:hypothetical protein
MLDIDLNGIQDPVVRDALYAILEQFRNEPTLNFGFKFFTIVFASGVTNYRFRHGLGFRPKDAIITDVSNDEDAYFDMDLSDGTHLDITASGACTIRFVVGNLDVNSQA